MTKQESVNAVVDALMSTAPKGGIASGDCPGWDEDDEARDAYGQAIKAHLYAIVDDSSVRDLIEARFCRHGVLGEGGG